MDRSLIHFWGAARSLSSPGVRPFAITPHDTNELPLAARVLYVGTAGDINLVALEGDPLVPVLFKNVDIGIFPMSVVKVLATGTTAQHLVGII